MSELICIIGADLNYWGPNQGFSRQFGNLSPFIATAFSLAKSDAGLLHSILSFSWGMISHLKGQSLSSPVCLSRGKSIMYLRGKLEHPQAFISSSSILTVCFLMTVDVSLVHVDAACPMRKTNTQLPDPNGKFDSCQRSSRRSY